MILKFQKTLRGKLSSFPQVLLNLSKYPKTNTIQSIFIEEIYNPIKNWMVRNNHWLRRQDGDTIP